MKKKSISKLKLGDTVLVIAGDDKGKKGKIVAFAPKKNALVVEGVNFIKKTLKKTQENQKGGYNRQEAPIHLSNVLFFDKQSQKPAKLARSRNKDGSPSRSPKIAKKLNPNSTTIQ